MRIIHVLRKPLSEGTVASNVLKHGTGGLNIDASRVGGSFVSAGGNNFDVWRSGEGREDRPPIHGEPTSTVQSGRWPANVILQHLDGCRCAGVNYADEDGKETWLCEPGCPVARLDSQTEPTKSKRSMRGVGWSDSEVFGSGDPAFDTSRGFDDTGGVSRFYKQVGGGSETT